MTQTLYCARHPKKETGIRCGRCDDPICPDCLVHSPVGMRCPNCARVNRVPTYDVTTPFLIRGIAAGVATALVLGAVFFVAAPLLFRLVFVGVPILNTILPYLYIVIISAVGFAIGEAVSLATNRKRGTKLKLVSAASMLLASVPMTYAFPAAAYGMLYLFIGLALATWFSIRRF